MIKACNLQKGQIVAVNGQPYQVKAIDVQTPSARGANTLYKVRLQAVIGTGKLEQTYKGTDTLAEMELERRPVSFLYRDQDMFTFMDTENYEQYCLARQAIEDQIPWLAEGVEGISARLLDGQILSIELPAAVDLEIVETVPAIKGATATNRNKPAVLANGVTVMVPEYLAAGDVIRVNTDTGKFMSRVRG
jgi:elongation factor P